MDNFVLCITWDGLLFGRWIIGWSIRLWNLRTFPSQGLSALFFDVSLMSFNGLDGSVSGVTQLAGVLPLSPGTSCDLSGAPHAGRELVFPGG